MNRPTTHWIHLINCLVCRKIVRTSTWFGHNDRSGKGHRCLHKTSLSLDGKMKVICEQKIKWMVSREPTAQHFHPSIPFQCRPDIQSKAFGGSPIRAPRSQNIPCPCTCHTQPVSSAPTPHLCMWYTWFESRASMCLFWKPSVLL